MIADIIAQDSRDRDVLIATVKPGPLSRRAVSKLFEEMELQSPSMPFGMVVDPNKIYLKKQGCEPRPETYRVLKARDMLRRYEPEYGDKMISDDYLKTLVGAWLRDLAYHWKTPNPPGAEELAQIGLLRRLAGGSIQSEVPVGDDSLH
jgi:hypothetical protein